MDAVTRGCVKNKWRAWKGSLLGSSLPPTGRGLSPSLRRRGVAACLGLLMCSSVLATDIDVSVLGGGSSNITSVAGGLIQVQVVVELTDDLNEGLAFIVFDLDLEGETLAPLETPTSAPMTNFVKPVGITNPLGFGGTLVGDVLAQVGGAQNTIKNDVGNAPFPIGGVVTGIAWPASPVTVASGWIDVPMTPGEYTLSLSNLAATVIEDGQDGSGDVWAVQVAGTGTVTDLTLTVVSELADPPTFSAPGGRYLSIATGAGSAAVSYRVTPACAGGEVRYVAAPTPPNNVALLVDNPLDAAWLTPNEWGSAVYVNGPDVIPSTDYELVVDTGLAGGANLSPATGTTTQNWGELNGLPPSDLDDILCMLAAFSNNFVCSLFASDLFGAVPDQLVDLDDILAVLGAFSGDPYPGASPCE